MATFEEIRDNIKSITEKAFAGDVDAQNKLGVVIYMDLAM